MDTNITFESMVKLATMECIYDEMSSIPDQDTLDTLYAESIELHNKMNKIIKTEKAKDYIKTFYNWLSKKSVIIIAVSLCIFTPILSAEAVQQSIYETVYAWYDKFINITFTNTVINEFKINDVEIAYLPEELQSSNTGIISSTYYFRQYESTDNFLNVMIGTLTQSDYALDNEYSDYQTIVVDNKTLNWNYQYESDCSTLIYRTNNFEIVLDGNLSLNELIKILNSISIL